MKILIANLKLFYQCRGLWFWYFIFGSFFVISFMMGRDREPGIYPAYILASLVLGALSAELQRDVLSKPFSYCMPRHRDLPRLLLFGIGGVTNIFYSLIFCRYSGVEFPHILLVFLAAILAGITCFLLGSWLVLMSKSMSPMAWLFPVIWILASRSDHLKYIEHVIVSFPLLLIAVGIASCGLAWKWLGRGSMARKFCGETLVGLADGFDIAKRREVYQKQVAQKASKKDSAISDRLEEFFLTRMMECRPFGGNRYVLGNMRLAIGRLVGPQWMVFPPVLIVMILIFGYMVPGEINSFFFILPAFGAVSINLIPYRNMLLPCGRAEKYYGAIVLGFAVTLLSILIVMTIALISVPLSNILPDITMRGETFTFDALDVRKSYLCLFPMPIGLLIGTLFSKRGLLIAMFAPVLMAFLFPFSFMSGSGLIPFSLDSLSSIAALTAISWISFALILRYHCHRRSLVDQGR